MRNVLPRYLYGLSVAIASLLATGCGVPTMTPVVDNSVVARDLAAALLIHDQSIRSLDWTQDLRLDVGAEGEVLRRTEQALDARGRWTCKETGDFRASDTGGLPSHQERYAFDGVRLIGVSDTSRSGTVGSYAGNRRSKVGIDGWLGRHIDVDGVNRLGEYLLAAPDLQVVGRSKAGLPILSATADLQRVVAILEVEVDPAHGFAPRDIVVRDRLIGVPYERYETLEFTSVEGHWLPTKGRLTSRCFAPTEVEAKRLFEATSARGVSRESDPFDSRVQQAYLAAVREVYGADEARSEPLVPPIGVEARVVGINLNYGDDRFELPLPEEYRILDTFHNLVKPANTAKWKSSGTH